MGSVLAAYLTMPFTRSAMELCPSWTSTSNLVNARACAGVVARLVAARDGGTIAHVHLSERGSFIREGALLAVAATARVPSVATLHGAEFEPFAVANRGLVRRVLRLATAVITLGPAMRDFIHAEIDPDLAIVVVPNPIELAGAAAPAGEQPPLAVFAGELGRRKGLDVLLAAWPAVRAAVPDATLVVCGAAADVAEPEGVAGIRWLGMRPRTEVMAVLADARVAVLPSRGEVMSMFLLEAMARARPVVTTPVGEHAWLVADGAGTVVATDDAAALAAALVDYLADGPAATAAGVVGRALVAQRHTGVAIAAALEQVYDVVGARRRPVSRRGPVQLRA